MTRSYPGMLDHSKEYFNNGPDVMMIHNGVVQKFDEVPEHPELAQIIATESDLNRILTEWFHDDEHLKQKTLAKCRFGALNFSADIHGETVVSDHADCPHRGKCRGEFIVCQKPLINGETVTTEEIEILKEICGNDKNSTIADNLGFALGTFKVVKTSIYKKCRFITKQQAAKVLFLEGLL